MCALNAKGEGEDGEEEGAAGAPFSSLIHRRRAHHLSGHSHLPLNLRLEVPPLKNCRKEKQECCLSKSLAERIKRESENDRKEAEDWVLWRKRCERCEREDGEEEGN